MGFFLRDNEFEKDLAKEYNSLSKSMRGHTDKALVGIIAIWALYVLAVLAFWAGLIYLALHFILKFW